MATIASLGVINSSGQVTLTEEVLSRLGVKPGDSLFLVETPQGCQITKDPPIDRDQFEAGLRIMEEYAETFKALAK
jgi:bifunctional DNA-binding transcriptional regulator/antitoxin component of YhaV-PrlF toxin-antitoxin module